MDSNYSSSYLNSSTEYKWYFLQITAIFVTLLSIFFAKHEILPFTYYTVPDSVYYEQWVFNPREKGFGTGFLHINTFLYSIGPQTFVFYNTALLLASIYFCNIFESFSSKAVSWARASIVFNPYLLISVIGPTKEINLIFFSLFAFYLFQKKSFVLKLLSVGPILGAMAIRPEFGLIIFMAFIASLGLYYIKRPTWICLMILLVFFLINTVPSINTVISNSGGENLEFFSTSNYYQVALILKAMQENPILQVPAIAIKAVLVMFAPIVRANNLFSPFIPLLDWGYTFMAYISFPINLSFLLLFIYQKSSDSTRLSKSGQLFVIYAFLGILSTIATPIIQARYLFPYAPFMAACFMLHNLKLRNRILGFSFFIIAVTFVATAVFFPRVWDRYTHEPMVYLSWI